MIAPKAKPLILITILLLITITPTRHFVFQGNPNRIRKSTTLSLYVGLGLYDRLNTDKVYWLCCSWPYLSVFQQLSNIIIV